MNNHSCETHRSERTLCLLFAGQEFPLNSRDDLGVEAKAFIIGEELVAGDYGIEV